MRNFYFTAKILLLSLAFFSLKATAQAPQKMSYQSVIRNSSNALVVNTAVGIKISVLQGTASGTAVYVETQTATTNANGLVSIQIGTGIASTGTFAGIDWSAGPYFIKTETDPLGGTNYTITGTQEMLSVPYAMYAAKSGDATTMGTIGGSSSTNGGTITGGVLSLTPANAANGGIVTTGAQTFAGAKTFTDDLKASQNIISGTPVWATDGKIQSWNTNYNGRVLSVIGNNANYTGAAASFWNQGSGPSVAFDYAGSGQKIISYQNQGNEVASVKTNGAINANSFVKTNGTSTQYLMADGSTSAGQVEAIAALQAQIADMHTQVASLSMPKVTIGDQVWTSTNLNVTTYRNGDPIPEVQDPATWATLTTGAWCYLNNDPANDAIYGKIYNHYAVEDPRGLAPVGYRIPTLAEWFVLRDYVGDNTAKLRSASFSGTNNYGFSVLKGGFRHGNESSELNLASGGIYHSAGMFATSATIFWCSDIYPAFNGLGISLSQATGSFFYPHNLGFYIRLLKN
jgi:uncharacterized protein (TIGR02145 family)